MANVRLATSTPVLFVYGVMPVNVWRWVWSLDEYALSGFPALLVTFAPQVACGDHTFSLSVLGTGALSSSSSRGVSCTCSDEASGYAALQVIVSPDEMIASRSFAHDGLTNSEAITAVVQTSLTSRATLQNLTCSTCTSFVGATIIAVELDIQRLTTNVPVELDMDAGDIAVFLHEASDGTGATLYGSYHAHVKYAHAVNQAPLLDGTDGNATRLLFTECTNTTARSYYIVARCASAASAGCHVRVAALSRVVSSAQLSSCTWRGCVCDAVRVTTHTRALTSGQTRPVCRLRGRFRASEARCSRRAATAHSSRGATCASTRRRTPPSSPQRGDSLLHRVRGLCSSACRRGTSRRPRRPVRCRALDR